MTVHLLQKTNVIQSQDFDLYQYPTTTVSVVNIILSTLYIEALKHDVLFEENEK